MESDKYITILAAKEGQLESLMELSKHDPWKPNYHIHPECGLLNDPNGLAYFRGEYHVFYQWFPFAPIHGMKHWAHVKSKDLIHWERMPVAIIPTEEYESHGAYSGSAIVKDDELLLFYTGNVKYSEQQRDTNQCLAIMNKNYEVSKFVRNPVIKGVPTGYTRHVRDPKVWEEAGRYYMILGAQKENLTGALLIYESDNAMAWNLKGEVSIPLQDFGYMWECPDYFTIGGKDILLFSPQGVETTGADYQNLYNVVYIIGRLDIEKLTFAVEVMGELDKGFDFYAPQTFQDEMGRRLLIGWAGAAENQYPSEQNQWSHCLTVPRQIVLEECILKQKPVEELMGLRGDCKQFQGIIDECGVEIENQSNSYELNVEFTTKENSEIFLRLLKSEHEEFVIHFDMKNNRVLINREKFINSIGNEVGCDRRAETPLGKKITAQIFVDQSIIEIFINDGITVLTARAFPQETITGIELSGKGEISYIITRYELKKSI